MGFAMRVEGIVSGAGAAQGQFRAATDAVTVRVPGVELVGTKEGYTRRRQKRHFHWGRGFMIDVKESTTGRGCITTGGAIEGTRLQIA